MSLFNKKNVVGIIEGEEVLLSQQYHNSSLLELNEIADQRPSTLLGEVLISYVGDTHFAPVQFSAINFLKNKLVGEVGVLSEDLQANLEQIKALKRKHKGNNLPFLFAYFDNEYKAEYETEAFLANLQANATIAFSLNDVKVYRLEHQLFSTDFHHNNGVPSRLINKNDHELNEEMALNKYKEYLRDLVKMYELYLSTIEGVKVLTAP